MLFLLDIQLSSLLYHIYITLILHLKIQIQIIWYLIG